MQSLTLCLRILRLQFNFKALDNLWNILTHQCPRESVSDKEIWFVCALSDQHINELIFWIGASGKRCLQTD
ncbi:hypothetical protein FGO68_gene5787 [Halteria grandinella]|uniref:Uncharacterized protein n=1 Tax=Halteria grandinella TaxID=5974 RepID=A0A8J8N9C8_HALGN|nr:hypothetical protein FGO68_gene5787 [Halteria grandinella]